MFGSARSVVYSVMTSDGEFIELFEAEKWPLDRWHHSDHIRLAYLYLIAHGFDGAMERLRTGIRRHNAAHGIVDAPTMGYHETMTRAWLTLVKMMVEEYGASSDGEAFVAAHPELSQKKTLRLFYSKDLFMSARAKVEWVEPDLGRFGG